MSRRQRPGASGPSVADAAHVAVAEQFVRLVRTLKRHHAQMVSDPEHNVEWASQILLRCLERSGPLRAGEVAEWVNADPSTVSRQVAALVKDGLLERRADPQDGRASLLALTDKASGLLRDYDASRDRHFARMLAGWSDPDLTTFAGLLTRFTDDFEAAIGPNPNPEGNTR